MRRVLVVLSVALLLADFPSIILARPRPESALDLIQIRWQELGYDIVFMPPRPGFRAMTLPKQHRIEVYARPQDDLERIAYDIGHELGHVIDLTFNTASKRREWMQLRGIDPSTKWFGCDACSDYKTPAGDFAETVAVILCGPKHFQSRMAPAPSPKDIPALVNFLPKALMPASPTVASAN